MWISPRCTRFTRAAQFRTASAQEQQGESTADSRT